MKAGKTTYLVIGGVTLALIVLATFGISHRRAMQSTASSVSSTTSSGFATTATPTGTSGIAATAAPIPVTGTPVARKRLERTVTVGGTKRTYVMYTPAVQLPAGEKYPVLFVYHPALADESFMETNAPFYKDPKANSFVVVYPQGVSKTWNAGTCCGLAHSQNVDDVGFFQAMMRDIPNVTPIRSKAYITGFSNGSMMVYDLVCKVPQLVEAAAPFAATISMDNCVSGYKIPIFYTDGGSDSETQVSTNPATAKFQNAANTLVTPTVALDPVAQRNGCTTTVTPTAGIPDWPDATCQAYSGCPIDGQITMCIIPNLGHAWPGSGGDAANQTGMMAQMAQKMGPYRPELNPTTPFLDFFLLH